MYLYVWDILPLRVTNLDVQYCNLILFPSFAQSWIYLASGQVAWCLPTLFAPFPACKRSLTALFVPSQKCRHLHTHTNSINTVNSTHYCKSNKNENVDQYKIVKVYMSRIAPLSYWLFSSLLHLPRINPELVFVSIYCTFVLFLFHTVFTVVTHCTLVYTHML